jgi:1-acyl-sn-glycerol-3-phosphate acyltransferase
VSPADIDDTAEITKWDPGLTAKVMGLIRPLTKGWHRSEVRGMDTFPSGGALVVSSHSGGLFPMDVLVFATGFYEHFGHERPVYTLSVDLLLTGPTATT